MTYPSNTITSTQLGNLQGIIFDFDQRKDRGRSGSERYSLNHKIVSKPPPQHIKVVSQLF